MKLIIRGFAIMTSQLCTYSSLKYLLLGDQVAMQQLSGPLTAVLAWLLLHERLTKNRVWGLATALVGVVLVAKPPILMGQPWGPHQAWGVAFAMGSVLMQAGRSLGR